MSKIKKLPSQAILKLVFDYNAETGVLSYKKRVPVEILKTYKAQSAYRHRRAGKECLAGKRGYVRAVVHNDRYLGHRIIWKLCYGKEPPPLIDHKDGDGSNNRLKNLREASIAQNMANAKRKKSNKTGVSGVLHKKIDGNMYWIADGRHGNKRHHLYCGKDFFEAVCARKSFEVKVGKEWYLNAR